MYRIIKNLIPNKIFLKLKYFKKFKQNLSFKNPKKFNEKLNYLKIYDDIGLKSIYQDKVEVKKIVGKKIGEKHIINTLKILDINSELESQLIEFDKFISEILDRAASDNFKAIISTSAIHLNVGCGFEKNQGLTLGQLAKNGILLLLNSLNEIFPHPSL